LSLACKSCVERVEPILLQRNNDEIIEFPGVAGLPVTIGEFLRSRIVELVVHLDDLLVSAGIDGIDLSRTAVTAACEVGTAINIERYGATEVLRALFRRERGSLESLRAF
jgi:hypothetical protein